MTICGITLSDNILGAIIGGLIAGAAGIAISYFAHHLEKKRNAQKKREVVHSFLLSILSEIESLWLFYMQGVGKDIDEFPADPTEPFRLLWPIKQDYFTIFESHAHMIGEIEDQVLRDRIIMAYNGAKSLIDQFQFHNGRLNELCEVEGMSEGGKVLIHVARYLVMKDLLIQDAKRLRDTHMQVKDLIANEETGVIAMLKRATA